MCGKNVVWARKAVILCPMCEKNVVWARKAVILCPKLWHHSLRPSLMLCGKRKPCYPSGRRGRGPRCQAWEGLFPLHTTLKRIASREGHFITGSRSCGQGGCRVGCAPCRASRCGRGGDLRSRLGIELRRCPARGWNTLPPRLCRSPLGRSVTRAIRFL